MRSPSYRQWTWISLLLLLASCALVLALHEDVRLLSALVLPPLVAGLTTTPRRTAVVTALTVVSALALGLRDDLILTTGHLLRVTVIAITSALAVQTAILRERDLRTRRRLSLINSWRAELDASAGLEDALASFARAAANEFADFGVLDIRLPDGSSSRLWSDGPRKHHHVSVRPGVSSVTTAYEADVQREGPLLLKEAESDLLDALFDDPDQQMAGSQVIVMPVSIGDVRATYFLVCPEPHPPWGEAEVTQVGSLARGAALKARSDQLIDRITHAQQELQESRDQVEAIVEGIADGVTAQSVDGTMIFANEMAAEMLGFDSADEMLGLQFSEVAERMELRTEDGAPFDPAELPSRRALLGEENPATMLRYVIKASGRELWTQVKATAIFDPFGDPVAAITVIEDLTEHRREEQAQRFLADASKSLSETLDYDSAIDSVAHAAVPAMADWCTVEMLRPDKTIETVAVAHSDPAKEAAILAYREDFPNGLDDEFGTGKVIRSGVGEVYEQVDREFLDEYFGDSGRAEAVDVLAPRSSLIAPITVRGEPIGAISMVLTRSGVRFTDYDLETAIELGRRAGIALDNARMHTERMRMLSSLQKSLIPASLPEIDGLSLSAAFRPAERDAEVGGDFYDAFELPDGSAALVIGDVCGKGPEAAAITALARYTIRTVAMKETDPQAILRQLNEALIDQVEDSRFCTVAFARIIEGPDGREIEAVSGGHPLPLILGHGAPRPLGRSGTLLGIVPDPDLPIVREPLPDDVAVMLYTDGLSAGQTTDDTAFAAEIAGEVSLDGNGELAGEVDRVARRSQIEPNRDDVAILVARVVGSLSRLGDPEAREPERRAGARPSA